MSRTLLSLAGFQVIISGRFWVIAEVSYISLLPCRRISVACQIRLRTISATRNSVPHSHPEDGPATQTLSDSLSV